MVYYGANGGSLYPEIKRTKLLSGEAYLSGESQHLSGQFARSPADLARLKKRSWSSQANLSSTNAYGLTSRSEFLFPEAFRPVDTKFWEPLSNEEHALLHMRQAQANLKAQFEDDDKMPLAATAADAAYMDAQVQRSQAMRRRRKPRNWDEKKKEELLRKKDPLVRRYNAPELIYREGSAIITSGALETPILVNGLPVINREYEPPAPKLKSRRPPRKAPSVVEQPQAPVETDILPTFDPRFAPKAKLTGYASPYGLASRSETFYPEAYRDISTVYWRKLSEQDRQKVMRVQAVAMEKVGYERGTEKRFIEDIEPLDDYEYKGRRGRRDDTVGRASSGLAPEMLIYILLLLFALGGLGYVGWRIISEPPQTSSGYAVPGLE